MQKVWLFEIAGNKIIREIGLDENENTILLLPNEKYPRGLFGDSNISFNTSDLIGIDKKEFESKWTNK